MVAWVDGAEVDSGYATSQAITLPAGIQAGDCIILQVVAHWTDNVAASRTINTPSGYTPVRQDTTGGVAASGSNLVTLNQAIFIRPAAGNESGTQVTVTIQAATVSSLMSIACGVWRGTAAKIQTSAGALGNTHLPNTSDSVVGPNVTTTSPCLLLSFFGGNVVNSSVTVSAGTVRESMTANNGETVGRMVDLSTQGVAGTGGAVTYGYTTSTVEYEATAAATIAIFLDTAPNAPTGLAPASSTTVDRSVIQRLSWTFSDPDAGDSQSKFDLQWRHKGTADAWNVVSQTTPNNYYDVPASTFPTEDIEWQVRTYDQAAAVGPYSALAYFTAANPATPATITAPTSGGTVSQNPTNVTWSTDGQQGYQVRRVRDNAGVADPTTVYYDTGQITDTTTRTVSVPFETNNRWEWVQVRVQQGGLWSAWSSIRVNVTYTPPAAPTLTINEYANSGQIGIVPSQATPAAGQPAVTSIDIYCRASGNVGTDPYRTTATRLAAGVSPTAEWIDDTLAGGVDYEYMVRANGSNGTTTDSAWTGAGQVVAPAGTYQGY